MKKLNIYRFAYITLTLLLYKSNLLAINIFVDPTLQNHCTNSNYSISNRNCTGSDGSAYMNVQMAINAMSGGDDIYLRGGTYTPVQLTGDSNNGAIHVPLSKNGNSSNWSSLQSYTGEWAILDGNNQCGTNGALFGYRDYAKDGSEDLKYWRLERLEVTNGASSDGTKAFGLWLNGGPFIVRYCYIHDNVANTGGANPAGITGMIMNNSIIEYNYFKDNGSNTGEDYEQHSVTGLFIHSDYQHTYDTWETAPYDIDHAMVKNEIRYNLFENEKKYARHGLANKGRQYLAHKTEVTWNYKEYGDKVHHNIFRGFQIGVACQQDFQQIYNNIIEVVPIINNKLGISIIAVTHSGNNMGVTVYNNTIIGGRISNNFGFPSGGYLINPYAYIYNNLMDRSPADYDSAAVINLGQPYMLNPYIYDPQRTELTNNYIYRSYSTNIKVTRNSGSCFGHIPVSTYNSCYNEINYSKDSSESTDAIYAGTTGADQYITRGTHLVSGSNTISNSGKGGNHPYLSNIALPSYIGATNPNDNNWVEGVLSLKELTILQHGSQTDPSWIEGGNGGTNNPTLSPPTNLRIY